jgi:translation elongation factor EF-1beta
LAGQVKEKYPDDVKVETVYSGFLGFGHKEDTIKPPNIAVDDKVLGAEVTLEDLEKAVKEKQSS